MYKAYIILNEDPGCLPESRLIAVGDSLIVLHRYITDWIKYRFNDDVIDDRYDCIEIYDETNKKIEVIQYDCKKEENREKIREISKDKGDK